MSTGGGGAVGNNIYHIDTEDRPEMYYSPYTRRAGDYSGYFSRQNSVDSSSSDRPAFLDISATKLRSSLKKSNYLSPAIRAQNTGGSSSVPGERIACLSGFPTFEGFSIEKESRILQATRFRDSQVRIPIASWVLPTDSMSLFDGYCDPFLRCWPLTRCRCWLMIF